jgi:hypothetical protein
LSEARQFTRARQIPAGLNFLRSVCYT